MSESSFPAGAIKLLCESTIRHAQKTGTVQRLTEIAKDMPREHIALLHYEFLCRCFQHEKNVTSPNRYHSVFYSHGLPSNVNYWCVEVELVP